MEKGEGGGAQMKNYSGLLIGVAVLQAACVGLILYFGFTGLNTDRTMLDRTGTMLQKEFPGIQGKLSVISDETSRVGADVAALRKTIAGMDNRLSQVDTGVGSLNKRVEGLSENVSGHMGDRSGAIWGQSLNPYLLIALLGVIAVSIPLWGLVPGWVRKSREQPSDAGTMMSKERLENLVLGLDRLSLLVDNARTEEEQSEARSPEMQKLIDETHGFISDAREELSRLSEKAVPVVSEAEEDSRSMH